MRARSVSSTRRPTPIVLGRHLIALGVPPGPRMGEILKQIFERQLDGEIRSLEEGLALARKITGP